MIRGSLIRTLYVILLELFTTILIEIDYFMMIYTMSILATCMTVV